MKAPLIMPANADFADQKFFLTELWGHLPKLRSLVCPCDKGGQDVDGPLLPAVARYSLLQCLLSDLAQQQHTHRQHRQQI